MVDRTYKRNFVYLVLVGGLALACTAEKPTGTKNNRVVCNGTEASLQLAECVNLGDEGSLDLLPPESRPSFGKSGKLMAIPGLSSSRFITADGAVSLQSLRDHPEEDLFSYAPPASWLAEYSAPQAEGASLALLAAYDSSPCRGVAAGPTVPKFKEVPQKESSYFVCIRLSKPRVGYVWLKLPSFMVVANTGDSSLWSKGFPDEFKPKTPVAGTTGAPVLPGYSPSLVITNAVTVPSIIQKNLNDKIFTYVGPPGWDASFSMPQLVPSETAANQAIDPKSGYEKLTYGPEEPRFKDLPQNEGSYVTYIRLVNEDFGVYYLKTPALAVQADDAHTALFSPAFPNESKAKATEDGTKLPGLTSSDLVQNASVATSVAATNADKPIFNYTAPDNWSPSYSQPQLALPGQLGSADIDPNSGFTDLTYSAAAPTFKDLDLQPGTYFSYIKLENDKLGIYFLKVPPLVVVVDDSLTDATLEVEAGANFTNNSTVTLSLLALGATQMYVTNTAGCDRDGTWEAYATSKAWPLAQNNATATVYAKFKNAGGKESSCVTDTILHDNQAPTATALTIASGAIHTSVASVSLNLAATDASEVYITNAPACSGGGSWEPYAPTKASWTLGQTNATASVYAKFRDDHGNESACTSDSIIHDNIAPSAPSLAIAGGASTTISTTVALNISAIGADEMWVTNTAGCLGTAAWEPMASSKSSWLLDQSEALATVYVKFRDFAGNESNCASDTITHDSQPPSGLSININSGATHTNATSVNVSLAADGASSMYLSNIAGCGSGGTWEPYATTASWSLGQTNATARVYVKYRDEAGNESSCINDNIIHDAQAPTATTIAIDGGNAGTNTTSVSLTLTATDAADMYITNTAGCASGGSWEAFAGSAPWVLAQTNATATVYVKYRDAIGNESTCIDDTITHSNVGPTGTSISIAAGASYTTTDAVTLTLAATGASEMYITNTAACGSDGLWEAYATSSPWTLGQTEGTATVYVKFRDNLGTESSCIPDTITHDSLAPLSTSISINTGAAYTTTTSATLTLAATGASEMYITDSLGCSAGGTWETYASSSPWTLAQTNSTATVYVKFKDLAGNESACINDTIIHDNQIPSSTSLSIDGGATYAMTTSVTLTLGATGASDMYITNTSGCGSDGTWAAYAASAPWVLGQSDASATVYVKFKDAAGNESACINDSITHDSLAPTSPSLSIEAGANYVTTTSVTLTLGATGASQMYIADAACTSGGTWETYATSKAWTLAQTNATATVYVKFRDGAGNETSCLSDTIIHDSQPPSGTSISINGGASYATTTAATLSLAATGASEMYITNTLGCGSAGTWEAYATTKAWTLGQTNGTATVYIKYKDAAGNEGSCLDDTITHDSLPPSGTTISINAGASYATSASVSLTLAATAATEMYITDTAACGSGGAWQAYATSAPWTLAQTNATATVYIKYKDAAGNESSCIDDTIIHDNQVPTTASISIASGATYATSTSTSLSLAATGADEMYVTNTAGCASGGTWEAYATSSPWTLAQSNATATVYIKYKDAAGNETSCLNDTIIHDNQVPTGASISIAAGASYTTSTAVTLSLGATGASEMYIVNTAGCGAGGSWVAYATSSPWTLTQTNTTATVSIKYRDAAGNETSCIDDSIDHDNQAPTSTSISIDGGAASAATTSVTLTLGATAASDMYITNTSGCGSGGAWESYSTSAPWTLGQVNSTATVYVKFKDLAGNETSCINDTITQASPGPTGISLSINGGAAYTTTTAATLTLGATNAVDMYVTNTSGCGSGGTWTSYATSLPWTLGQTNGTATVYVKFRDNLSTESACIPDTITHDNTAPTATSVGINAGATYTTTTAATLTLAATGASSMYITNTSGCGSGGSWTTYATSSAWTLGQTEGTATVYVKYIDSAGNESSCINDTITHDSQAPTSTSISIDAGASYATGTAVTLTLAATGASDMYITNTSGCGSGGTWASYATSSAWTLGQTNATATVYIKYKDAAGNESSCINDTITHDNQAPSATSISINAGATYATTTSATLTLAATGASNMYITNTSGCGSGGSWAAYGTSSAWTLGQTNTTATVYVKFKDAAGNESSCINDTIVHDSQGPTATSLSINAGSAYTTSTSATLTLAATDANDMYISNTSGCGSGGSWETYATSKAWTLGQTNATATVYVQFRDVAGNVSSCINDTIVHDTTAPTSASISIDVGATYATTTSVTLTLAATGASDMYVTNTAACSAGGSWEAYATSKGWTLGQTNATATVYIKYKDAAGNESSCINDTITHDNTAPTSTSISINAGDTYTTSTSATLTLAATGASDMYVTDTAACGSGGTWEAYTTSKAWTLAQTNATATVYVKFKDAAGNESSCINDTITHDNTAPTVASISINAGASYTTSTSVTLTLAATGALTMYITNTAGCASGGSVQAYGTSKAWTLGQSEGTATVYVVFRDAAGNATSCLSDTIVHDATAPTSTSISINGGAGGTTSTAATLTLAATGASDMYITNTSGCGSGGSWETYATSKSWTLGQTETTATVYVKFRDAATNVSSCINDTIVHDTVAPTSPTLSISSGASYTSSSSVSLTPGASGASEMYITNTSGCGSGGSWETYATTKSPWTLGQTNATATVYIKFRDIAGNTTSCVSDTIVHDSVAPTTPGSFDDGGTAINLQTSPSMSWSASTDSNSGIQEYQVCIGTSAGDNSALDWTSIGNVTSGTIAGATLVSETTYYASIRAVDRAGNVSAVAQGNGFIVGWFQEAYVKAPNPGANDVFGSALSIDGDTLVAGASYEDSSGTTITNGSTYTGNESNTNAGIAYVFKRTNTTWALQATLKAANAFTYDYFGVSVGVSGDTIAVGANYEDHLQSTVTNGTTAPTSATGSDAGSVYVYKRSGTTWAQEAYLKAANPNNTDYFGTRVYVAGNTIAVAAMGEDSSQRTITNGASASADNSASSSGAVYVFSRSGTTWSQQAYIKAGNAKADDVWGANSISLDGDTLAVGHPLDDSNVVTITNGASTSTDTTKVDSGAAFVYKRTGTIWAQEAYIKAVNADADDRFGHVVSLSGNTLAVSARYEDSNVTTVTNGATASADNSSAKRGAAYVYTRSGTTWSQQAYIKTMYNKQDEFGTGMALSGDYLAVGAPYDVSTRTYITNNISAAATEDAGYYIGAVHVFKRTGTAWTYKTFIKPPVNRPFMIGGDMGLSMSATTIVASSRYDDSSQSTITNGTTASSDTTVSGAGGIFIFRK